MKKKNKLRLDEWIDLGIGMSVVTFFVVMGLFDDTRDVWDKVILVILYICLYVLLYFQYK